tara:strand:+ start:84 stop:530 length:447 start_codon:yes stop_codon:yes gene_type:complete
MTTDFTDKESLIGQSKIFGLLDDEGLKELVALGESQDMPSGEIIIREGEWDSTFYLLLDGTVEILIDKFGEAHRVGSLQSGAVFGEIAALVGENRTATVRTVTPVKVLAFDGTKIQGILKKYPVVREAIMKLGLKRSEDTMREMLSDD